MKAVCVAISVAVLTSAAAIAQAPREGSNLPDPPAALVEAYLRQTNGDAVFRPAAPGDIKIATGKVKQGDRFLSWPVTYARTGVLRGDARYGAMLGRSQLALESGADVFAMPYQAQRTAYAPIRQGLAWCGLASRGDSGKVKGFCLIDFGRGLEQVVAYGRNVIQQESAYVPGETALLGDLRGPAPKIDERAVDFGVKLESAFTFEGWKKSGAAVRRGVYDPKGHTARIIDAVLKREADGSALLRAAGGVIRLRPAGDDGRALIEIVEAPRLETDDDRRGRAIAALREAFPGRGRDYPATLSAADPGVATKTP